MTYLVLKQGRDIATIVNPDGDDKHFAAKLRKALVSIDWEVVELKEPEEFSCVLAP
jgi:hypothetical protein